MTKMNFVHIPKNGGSSINKIIKENPDINLIYNGHAAEVSILENQLIMR